MINSFHAKLHYLNFHQLEAVSRYRDPQLQVGDNYSYLLSLDRALIYQFNCLNAYFIPITVVYPPTDEKNNYSRC